MSFFSFIFCSHVTTRYSKLYVSFRDVKRQLPNQLGSAEPIRTIDGKPGRIHSGNGFPALLGNGFERLAEAT
jgi:hypothetical protein